METDVITLLFEGGTVIATLALAIFLSFQLRLQHKESTISAQGELTSSLAEITRDVYNSNELTDIYLRGMKMRSIVSIFCYGLTTCTSNKCGKLI